VSERSVAFTLNGEPRERRVAAHQTLLEVLRDDLGAVEVKEGCGEGVCGTCTVLLDGEPVSSCLLLAVRAAGREVTTVRGLAPAGALDPLQESFVAHGAAQCGFCTPGMILTAHAFLREHPRAGREEIRRAISGNLCRCTGYTKIIDAIEAAANGTRKPT
jgi:aerobic carbon-monoxide dehydrogenase small subunit